MASSSNSILLDDVVLKGKITEKENIIIGCKFEGNVIAEDVTFSESAEINGDVNANKVKIEGKVKGAVTSQQLSIKENADVEGDLITERLSIDDGAKVKIQALTKKGV
jgi:cytoskeletal protein CcmA (bactofilin family)